MTDITEFKLKNDQKLYLSTFMDVYSLEIISFSMSNRATLDIVMIPLQALINQKTKLKGLSPMIFRRQAFEIIY